MNIERLVEQLSPAQKKSASASLYLIAVLNDLISPLLLKRMKSSLKTSDYRQLVKLQKVISQFGSNSYLGTIFCDLTSTNLIGKTSCTFEISEDSIEIVFNESDNSKNTYDLSTDDFLDEKPNDEVLNRLVLFHQTLSQCIKSFSSINIYADVQFYGNGFIDSREVKYLKELARLNLEILSQITTGLSAGFMPWYDRIQEAVNPLTGKYYSGKNLTLLASKCKKHRYEHNVWATYIQWKKKGANVNRNESGTQICLAIPKKVGQGKTEDLKSQKNNQLAFEFDVVDVGTKEKDPQFIFRYFYVFNASQVSGYDPNQPDFFNPFSGYSSKDLYHEMISRLGLMDSKRTSYSYESLVKLINWTGGADRCNRSFIGQSEKLDLLEKLICELGASILSHKFQIPINKRPSERMTHELWSKLLKEDFDFYYIALNLARSAVYWLYYNTQIVYPPLPKQPLATISDFRLNKWLELIGK